MHGPAKLACPVLGCLVAAPGICLAAGSQAMAQKLRVPEQNYPALRELKGLSPDERKLMIKMLKEGTPTLSLESLTRGLADSSGIAHERARRIVDFLVSLNGAREFLDLEVGEFVKQFQTAIEDAGQEDLRPDDWDEFSDTIRSALSGDGALALSAKAIFLLRDHNNIFASARVMTDLRPIFRSDVAIEPAAFLAVHTLKLSYDTSSGVDDFYVAMDRTDVTKMIDLLQRALEKEASLRDLTVSKGMFLLEAHS
jgi:hypothetical protein